MTSNPDRCWLDRGWWWTTNAAGQPTRRLLSWNAGTKELALLANNRFEKDLILAVIDTEDEVVQKLAGWEEYVESKNGLTWLEKQLEVRDV